MTSVGTKKTILFSALLLLLGCGDDTSASGDAAPLSDVASTDDALLVDAAVDDTGGPDAGAPFDCPEPQPVSTASALLDLVPDEFSWSHAASGRPTSVPLRASVDIVIPVADIPVPSNCMSLGCEGMVSIAEELEGVEVVNGTVTITAGTEFRLRFYNVLLVPSYLTGDVMQFLPSCEGECANATDVRCPVDGVCYDTSIPGEDEVFENGPDYCEHCEGQPVNACVCATGLFPRTDRADGAMCTFLPPEQDTTESGTCQAGQCIR